MLMDNWMPSGLVSKIFSFGAAADSDALAVATASIEARNIVWNLVFMCYSIYGYAPDTAWPSGRKIQSGPEGSGHALRDAGAFSVAHGGTGRFWGARSPLPLSSRRR